MIDERCWLPDLEYFSDYDNNWSDYQNALYAVFSSDFIASRPVFEGKQVNIRKHPIEYGKEEAFFHVTCQDYTKQNDRVPDLRRCERIRWIRAFIENYGCDCSLCDDCSGIKVWSEPYKNTSRVHLLFEEERYIVILERRESYCLLITAFYIEYDHTLAKYVKRYTKYKNF